MTALKHWLVFLLICLSAGLAEAEDAKPLRGVALVIGQANYAHIAPLPNAGSDARAIGKLMTDMGFETRLAPDRNAKALRREIDRFIEDAEGADVALVYYAGHGVEAAGENWLVPVDADLSSLSDARRHLVAISQMVERLKQAAPVVILLLDACRNSPFPADALLKPDVGSPAAPVVATGLMPARGMAAVEDQPAQVENVGTVLGFAAEPGRAALDGPDGGNSPYAQALLRHLAAMAGAEFGDVMTMVTEEVYLATGARQRPWVNASMRRLLYFGMAPQADDKDESLITGERRNLLLTIAALPSSGRRQVETIARSDAVPLDALYGMLRSLGAETPKDPAELDRVLRAQAEKLKTILAETTALKTTDAEIVRLSGLADRALTQGALATAITFREQAKARAVAQSAALDQTEADLAARRLELADVFVRSGQTYMLAFNFAAAATDFERAFREAERWDIHKAWTYKLAAAEALTSHGRYKGDNAALDDAISAYEQAGGLLGKHDNSQEWMATQAGLASALQVLGERESSPATLTKVVAVLEAVLSETQNREASPVAADIHNRLALALWRLGERESSTASLERAAANFAQALALLPRADASFARALIESNRGVVLMTIGQRLSGTEKLDEAIAAFARVLDVFNAKEVPFDWAIVQNNLGQALRYKGERETGTATLERSVAAFNAALGEIRRQDMPISWAEATGNLGMALWRLGERQEDNANLVAAASAFSAALEELTRERGPLAWAALQNNRGLVLLRLGEREQGTASLTQAAAAFEMALTERRREIVPLGWAESQNNLGTTLLALGQREAGTASLMRAVAAFEAALTEATRERLPLDWATTTTNLGITLTHLGTRESGTVSLGKAVTVLREALTARSRENAPLGWAETQYHLGNALLERGRRDRGAAHLHDAAAAYREAQTAITQDNSPFYWAAIENNRGAVHLLLGRLTGAKSDLEIAKAATAAAWDVYKAAGYKAQDAHFETRLAEIDAALADLK